MKIAPGSCWPEKPIGFPPSFAPCPDCDYGMIFLGSSGGVSRYGHTEGCKKGWWFQTIPWNHPSYRELERDFHLNDSRTAAFGWMEGEQGWEREMQPVLYQCACCEIGKIGFWTKDATAGFYLLKAWPEKTPSLETRCRFHGGYDSGTPQEFLCDECAAHKLSPQSGKDRG